MTSKFIFFTQRQSKLAFSSLQKFCYITMSPRAWENKFTTNNLVVKSVSERRRKKNHKIKFQTNCPLYLNVHNVNLNEKATLRDFPNLSTCMCWLLFFMDFDSKNRPTQNIYQAPQWWSKKPKPGWRQKFFSSSGDKFRHFFNLCHFVFTSFHVNISKLGGVDLQRPHQSHK